MRAASLSIIKAATFLSLFWLLPISTSAQQLVRGCIDSFLMEGRPEGDILGFSHGTVETETQTIVEASGLQLSDVLILECVGSGSAHASVIISELDEGRPGRFLTYDPDWIRQISGEDRWVLITILAHEIGHFANGHFAYTETDLKDIETEADRYAGCVVGRMRGNWGAVADTMARIRREEDLMYPDRLQSLEAARAGFDACASANTIARNPPGSPLTRDQRQVVEGLLGWIQSERVTGWFAEPNQRALATAFLTSLLISDRLLYVGELRALLEAFQEDLGLPVTGNFDSETLESVVEALESNRLQPQIRRPDAESVALRECVFSEDIAFAAQIIGLQILDLNGAQLCDNVSAEDGAESYSHLADLTSLQELSLRDVRMMDHDITDEISELTQLRWLMLRGSDIGSYEFLVDLKGLELLDLERTSFSDSDMRSLRNLNSLQSLSIHGTSVTDITALRNLTRLRELEISFTGVVDVSPLLGTDLVALEAWNTPVRNFGILSRLVGLDRLDARSDTLTAEDLEAFKEHPGLEDLSLKPIWEGTPEVSEMLALTADLAISFKN